MKKALLLFSLSILVFSCKMEEKETVYYLIRHAEKDRSNPENKNPNLSRKGFQRAKFWSNYFQDITLNAVYATPYERTMQTAKPVSESKGLDIQQYDPRSLYNINFATKTFGKSVLVVGHSNTTPAFVNRIIEENSNDKSFERYSNMRDDDNATLYIVKISTKGDHGKSTVIHYTEKVDF